MLNVKTPGDLVSWSGRAPMGERGGVGRGRRVGEAIWNRKSKFQFRAQELLWATSTAQLSTSSKSRLGRSPMLLAARVLIMIVDHCGTCFLVWIINLHKIPPCIFYSNCKQIASLLSRKFRPHIIFAYALCLL